MKTITIIGAGLGGLTSGALLAKAGYKVTVLEQHSIVGGCATVFKRGNFICEVGLHELDNVYNDPIKKEIFETLGIYNHVEFVPSREFFRIKTDLIDFTMPHDKDEAVEKLVLKYPKEREAIQHYFELIGKISDEFIKLQSIKSWQYLVFPFVFRTIAKYKNHSVKEVMNQLFVSEELKLILNANVGYYHDKIGDFSFLFHSIAQNSYYSGGSWYIKGGSQNLSDYLASIIKNNGGEIITKAEVMEIRHTKKNVASVVYIYKKKQIELKNDMVISNISPQSTYTLANMPYSERKNIASSYFVIYIGFNKNLKKLYGEKSYSQFYFTANTLEEYDLNITQDITKRGFVFVDYSQIDAGLCNEDKSYGAVCTSDFLANWENLSEEEYKNKKQEVLQSYLNILEKEYPNIGEHISFAEIGTPKTIKRYIRTQNGTPNGFAPTASQFFRIPQLKSNQFNNLYFTGAWILGGGFTSAIISGKMCAEKIWK